jgi:hypothetical protein
MPGETRAHEKAPGGPMVVAGGRLWTEETLERNKVKRNKVSGTFFSHFMIEKRS